MEAIFRTILLLTVSGALASPRVIQYNNFIQPETKSPAVLEGSLVRHARGIRIEPNSRVRLASFQDGVIRNAAVEVDFVSPAFTPHRMPILADIDRTCQCALKLYLGRTVLIASDQYITLGRLDEMHTGLEHTYGKTPFTFPPHAEERTIRLEIRDSFARVVVESTIVLESSIRVDKFDHVDMQTYARGFTVVAFELTEYVKDTLYVNAEQKFLEAAAVYTPSNFNTGALKEHHLVGWKHSPAGAHSLFQMFISPADLDKALTQLGASPGTPLPRKTWTARYNANQYESELTVDGSRIEISVAFRDSFYHIEDIVQKEDGSAQPHRFRFGAGHVNHSTWKSGCTVCLLSCPAGIVGSETVSVGEWIRHPARHRVSPKLPFAEDDIVILRFTIRPSPVHASTTENETEENDRNTAQPGGNS